MLAILAPILVFGLVIFVHELGHFIAAKATGVYAPRFSIGFGPAIFKLRRGETEYVLAWLPLGGYVRMASRHDAETAFLEGGSEEATAKKENDPDFDPNAMIPFGPKPVPEDRWFESKPLWARIIIMTAGVIMNIVLAVAVSTALVSIQGEYLIHSTVVGSVRPVSSAPELSALQTGDTIRSVNGQPVSTWNDVRQQMLTSADHVELVTNRGTVRVPLGEKKAGVLDVARAVGFYLAPVIDSVMDGDPAVLAGLRHGDSVVSVNGKTPRAWSDIVEQVSASPGQPVQFIIAHAGAPKLDTISVTPKVVEQTDSTSGKTTRTGMIGAAARTPVVHHTYSIGEGFRRGVQSTWRDAGGVFRFLHEIGSGARSVRELGGPIAITKAAVDAAKSGFEDLLGLIAFLSINVAVLNMLPIPILDGGQILINVIESAKGSPFTLRTREYILRFGLVAIALLFMIVMYNDTRAGFVKLFGWVGRLFGA